MFNTNSIYQFRWAAFREHPSPFPSDALRFEMQLQTGEGAFNRATGAASRRKNVAMRGEVSNLARFDFRHKG